MKRIIYLFFIFLALGCTTKPKENCPDLVKAAYEGDYQSVRVFVGEDSNCDLNSRDASGATALMWLSFRGDVDLVKFFIKEGADLGAADNDGNTALTYAESFGNYDIIKLLKDAGAKE